MKKILKIIVVLIGLSAPLHASQMPLLLVENFGLTQILNDALFKNPFSFKSVEKDVRAFFNRMPHKEEKKSAVFRTISTFMRDHLTNHDALNKFIKKVYITEGKDLIITFFNDGSFVYSFSTQDDKPQMIFYDESLHKNRGTISFPDEMQKCKITALASYYLDPFHCIAVGFENGTIYLVKIDARVSGGSIESSVFALRKNSGIKEHLPVKTLFMYEQARDKYDYKNFLQIVAEYEESNAGNESIFVEYTCDILKNNDSLEKALAINFSVFIEKCNVDAFKEGYFKYFSDSDGKNRVGLYVDKCERYVRYDYKPQGEEGELDAVSRNGRYCAFRKDSGNGMCEFNIYQNGVSDFIFDTARKLTEDQKILYVLEQQFLSPESHLYEPLCTKENAQIEDLVLAYIFLGYIIYSKYNLHNSDPVLIPNDSSYRKNIIGFMNEEYINLLEKKGYIRFVDRPRARIMFENAQDYVLAHPVQTAFAVASTALTVASVVDRLRTGDWRNTKRQLERVRNGMAWFAGALGRNG